MLAHETRERKKRGEAVLGRDEPSQSRICAWTRNGERQMLSRKLKFVRWSHRQTVAPT